MYRYTYRQSLLLLVTNISITSCVWPRFLVTTNTACSAHGDHVNLNFKGNKKVINLWNYKDDCIFLSKLRGTLLNHVLDLNKSFRVKCLQFVSIAIFYFILFGHKVYFIFDARIYIRFYCISLWFSLILRESHGDIRRAIVAVLFNYCRQSFIEEKKSHKYLYIIRSVFAVNADETY